MRPSSYGPDDPGWLDDTTVSCTCDPAAEPTQLVGAVERAGSAQAAWRLVAGVFMALVLVAGCSTPPDREVAPVASGGGDVVALLISGTRHEPLPMVTRRGLEVLRTAAESDNATDGPGGVGSLAVITSADGEFRTTLPLTPRRENGAVEHGLQRERLIADNLGRVLDTVKGVSATESDLDLLEGMDDAVSGKEGGTLVVISNGLSTQGGFDLRRVGWNADPDEIAAQLDERNLLPDLEGWHVLWIGLNETAGDQPELPKPARDINTGYWMAICEAGNALSCAFDETSLEVAPPISTVDTAVVPVPEISSVIGPVGETITSLPDALLGFEAESATLGPGATDLITNVAADIVAELGDRPEATVTVTGFTADPPGSTPAGRRELALARAEVVAGVLRAAGVTNEIRVSWGGAAPDVTAMRDGVFVEALAQPMRRVEVTF